MRGFLAVVDTAFRQFFRDRQGLFWGIAFPIMMMGLIGSVFGGGTTDLVLTTSVVYEAEDPLTEAMVAALESVPALRIVEEGREEALERLQAGDRSLVVVLPAFAQAAGVPLDPPGDSLPVEVFYDEQNFDIAQAGIAIVGGIVDEFNRRLAPRVDMFRVDPAGVSAHQLSMFDFLLPGILAMVLMQTGLMGVTSVMTSYRERRLLKRVLATPFPPTAFLAGLVARFTVTNLLQGLIIVVVGVLVFKAQVVGSYGNMFVLSLLGSVAFLCMGFAISTLSKTPDGANTFGSAVSFPMMFLSGTFWPRELIPDALQPVIDALPLTPLVEALRGVATRGDGLALHLSGMLYLIAWAVVALIVAARRFRWE